MSKSFLSINCKIVQYFDTKNKTPQYPDYTDYTDNRKQFDSLAREIKMRYDEYLEDTGLILFW